MVPLRAPLVCTIFIAALQLHLVAADPVSEDVPVPGGSAALAGALQIHPVPDRAWFVSEVARIVSAVPDRKAGTADSLERRLRRFAASVGPGRELVPVPLTAAVWSDILGHRVTSTDLVVAILSDRQAALICRALAGLDDETLQYLADHSGILKRLYRRNAAALGAFGGSLRIHDDRVVPPGGVEATPLWEAIIGEKVTRVDRFLALLFEQGEGRTAYLYDTIGQLDRPRAAFALGSWIGDGAARVEAMRALAVAWTASLREWPILLEPYARQAYDVQSLLMRVRVDDGGRLAAPSSRALWADVFDSADLPDPSPRALEAQNLGNGRPIDAAWLIGAIAGGDARTRADRLDQFAFGQRVFGAATADQESVFVALRAFRRYRMLMLTLDRMGFRRPELYAAAARQAREMSPLDRGRAFVAVAQFQGALTLLQRMLSVGTLDRPKAESFVGQLVAVPLNHDGQYAGGILRWVQNTLLPAIPPADSIEAAILGGVSGPLADRSAPRIVWEGQTYRVDLAAAELRRLDQVRRKQRGVPLDLAFELAAVASRLSSPRASMDDVHAVNERLVVAIAELKPTAETDDPGLPPGVEPTPDPREALVKASEELTKIARVQDFSRAPSVSAAIVQAADELAARVFVSIVYAMNIGDPEGGALLIGDVSHRHDFGFGLRSTDQRLRAPWAMPNQDVSAGISWHVDGSLLGLDVALASLQLRRVNTDNALAAPTLTSNERETFAITVGLMNPFTLSNATRDALVDAIGRGRRRVAAVRATADADRIAGEIDMDGWRRRALRWTLAHEPNRLESMFSLGELLALGEDGQAVDSDAWGLAALTSTGCVCSVMPAPGRVTMLTGRPQIGLLATAVPDLNLHVALMLAELRLPASLAKPILGSAVQDFIDEVRSTDPDDWLSLVRAGGDVPRQRIEDYVAVATAGGVLVPDGSPGERTAR